MQTIIKKSRNTEKKPQKVFVALSGGVDSAVAAAVLKKQGYDVYGIYMKEWVPSGMICSQGDDRISAAQVAAYLNIPFAIWDFGKEYERDVARYMLDEYASGLTPNPDVMCNSKIKFGVFLKHALRLGADSIATGHYIIKKPKSQIQNPKFSLLQSKDKNKDQSYFLWTLTQDQLQYCLFPIGNFMKPYVRRIAKQFGLPNWDRKDSQGVCFVGKFNFGEFLRTQIPKHEGVLVTTSGEAVGVHDGVQFYTIGQRHGIQVQNAKRKTQNFGNTKPVYIAGKNITTNMLVIAEEDDSALYRKEVLVSNVNWISGRVPELPLHCQARIRHRQTLQKAAVSMIHDSCFMIHFNIPQRAVAPGQSLVFYKGKEMIGGGVIT